MSGIKVVCSPFKNPYINLSLEDFFLRGGADLPLLFFYVNRPCVVLGRFQNPWIETNLPYLTQNDIWMVRRQSGGGCVYHDEGNLNFSFITPEGMIDRKKFAHLLQEAFKMADIELSISPRNDLWMNDHKGQAKKISGSAYKQTKDASFHHGTFLVSSDLLKLEEALKHTIISKNTKSIPSVRSKVITLQERYPDVEIKDVIDLISHYFKTIPLELDGSLLSHPLVQKSFNELTGWEWLWGETPSFELETSSGQMEIRKGMIVSSGHKFEKESMKNILDEKEINRLFPDFSEQHRLSSQIL